MIVGRTNLRRKALGFKIPIDPPIVKLTVHPDCKVHGFVQQKFTLQAGEEANHIFYNNAHTVLPKTDLI